MAQTIVQSTDSVPTEAVKPVSPTLKHDRLIIAVGGSKGGPGKSTFARLLADLLHQRKTKFTAIDADTENSQLFRHYAKHLGVQQINLTHRETLIDFLRDLSTQDKNSLQVLAKLPEKIILVDLPSGAEGKFRTFENDFGFLGVLDELGWDVCFVNLMSPIKDCVNALRLLMELATDRDNAHVVAVQNLHFGEPRKFQIFDRSELKKQLLKQGLLLQIPELDIDTYQQIDELDLPFRKAAAVDSPLFLVHRGYVFKWLEKSEKLLLPGGSWLGL